MTFIVYKRHKYLVKNPLCLGRECLVLGEEIIKKSSLDFSKKPEIKILCCTRMAKEGCPTIQEFPFSKEVVDKRTKKGYSIRLI